MKKILIFGITGQDGILLSEYLLKKNFNVFGITRRKKNNFLNKKVKLIYKRKLSSKNISYLIGKIKPKEIYFLIGQPNSQISFKLPKKTFESNFFYFTYVINTCINLKIKPKIFYASSGEIFGNKSTNINEKTDKEPTNPYALSKYLTMVYIDYMRKYYNLNISVGILFNHDSHFRSKNNLIKKVANYLNKKNFKKKLTLGNIDIYRDFGLASEYVKAMYKINQQKKGDDYIIASGKSVKLRDIISYAFNLKKLNYKHHIKINKNMFPKKVSSFNSVNISKVKKIKWYPKNSIFDLLRSLVK